MPGTRNSRRRPSLTFAPIIATTDLSACPSPVSYDDDESNQQQGDGGFPTTSNKAMKPNKRRGSSVILTPSSAPLQSTTVTGSDGQIAVPSNEWYVSTTEGGAIYEDDEEEEGSKMSENISSKIICMKLEDIRNSERNLMFDGDDDANKNERKSVTQTGSPTKIPSSPITAGISDSVTRMSMSKGDGPGLMLTPTVPVLSLPPAPASLTPSTRRLDISHGVTASPGSSNHNSFRMQQLQASDKVCIYFFLCIYFHLFCLV